VESFRKPPAKSSRNAANAGVKVAGDRRCQWTHGAATLSIAPVFGHARAVMADHGIAALLNPGGAEDFFEFTGDCASFEPSSRDFNRANALWLAEFCRLIYRQEHDEQPGRPPGFRTRDQILAAHGWREGAIFRTREGRPQAALFGRTRGDAVALVFRGTLGLRDLLTDVRWVLCAWAGDGRVHEGFKETLEPWWPDVRARLREVRGPVFLAGHSLGGALATMTAALCRRELPARKITALYTFGSPRVGDRRFGAALDGVAQFRVVNGNDLIPRLPPVIPNPVLPYFEHSGRLHHLVDGGLHVYPPGADPFDTIAGLPTASEMRGMPPTTASASGQLPSWLADHAPVNYVARLEHFPA